MSFIGIMLAVFCGIWLFELSTALIKAAVNCYEDRHENDKKIGFGDDDRSTKKAKGATMRRIGFGAND